MTREWPLNKHTYLCDTAGQRQRNTLTDNSYTTYGYDDDAQLTSSLGYTSGGSPIASEQLGFGYDGGWNMTSRSVNGTPSSYIVNDLNQVTNAANVPCSYDQNGNRITSGQGSGTTQYTYDDENRLTRVSYSTAYRTDFTYDGLGRLRVRTEYTYYYGQWNVASVTRYIYDGKRVIQERDGNNTPAVSYTRGKDLSGSLEGAGGIGGLLARSHGYSGGNWSTHNFYHADGNGNVTYMINSAQALVASYKYDPYGRTVSSSGSLAAANLYRFSSKEIHVNSGLYYYLYRFYDPNTQRWLNRDPLGEGGGINVYIFAANVPANVVDRFGLQGIVVRPQFPRGEGGVFAPWVRDPYDLSDINHALNHLEFPDWRERSVYGCRFGCPLGTCLGHLSTRPVAAPPPVPPQPLPPGSSCSICPVNNVPVITIIIEPPPMPVLTFPIYDPSR
ncbi:MAG TPA: RHS repeat-associated core domain-containing protein [Verrucomicrobiae bacterium]